MKMRLTSTALLCALALSGAAAAQTCSDGPSCAAPAVKLTPQEARAADWALARIQKAGSVEKALAGLTGPEFLKRGGFDTAGLDLARIKQSVKARLMAADPGSATRCEAYGACAIGVDLTEASGPLLVKYEKKKAEDGRTFKDLAAPAFALKDLDGRTVSLADFKGKRLAIAFWQSHCKHSQKSLPVWNALRTKLRGRKFELVTVLFNGGDAPYVKTWYAPMGLQLPVLLAENDALAEAYGSHLVPSVFLVDAKGKLVKKLVTQQPETALRAEITRFARGG